jgi:exoribonuclease II
MQLRQYDEYADDIKIYGACSPSKVQNVYSKVSESIDNTANWMQSSKFQ